MAPTKAVHRSQFSGAESKQGGRGRTVSGPGEAKGRCLLRYHYRNLQKPYQGVSSLHQHYRWQHSARKCRVSMLLPCPLMKVPDGTDNYRKDTQLCPGKYFKNKFTNAPIKYLLSTNSMKDIFHTLVVKVLVSFMLNLIGLLLRAMFIGFSEAPAAVS